jgi:hypothetical protein
VCPLALEGRIQNGRPTRRKENGKNGKNDQILNQNIRTREDKN